METKDYIQKTKSLIDQLKAICNSYGLRNGGDEYKVIVQTFLYKFLNDKFLHSVSVSHPELHTTSEITDFLDQLAQNNDNYQDFLDSFGGGGIRLQPNHLISYLYNRQSEPEFAKLFDDTLADIAQNNAGVFSVHTDEGAPIPLFDANLFGWIISDSGKRDPFARAIINVLATDKLDFTNAFSQGFDFFSTIFEYLIKDYNANGGGVYAEYYTPHSVAKIISEILTQHPVKTKSVRIYDPAAGSGTLLINLAHIIGEDKCSTYSQDISQKSSQMLRLNYILNNLAPSIKNVVQGNTILSPKNVGTRPEDKFDYIVSNPPFKLDFSSWRDQVANEPDASERFFAGVPKIPNKAKDKMAIYLLFIQHILYNLAPSGRAALVVPTGFISAQSGIEKKIRQRLVEQHWLKGAISMPSNIFANTGTNVSVVFIDKLNTDNKVVLVDASKLGTDIKTDGKNQRTVLSPEEEQKIIDTFNNIEAIDDFSVTVTYDEIKDKNYSLSAGQYFDIKIPHVDITEEEFNKKLASSSQLLASLFAQSDNLKNCIVRHLDNIHRSAE